jgi:hypothetical protein
MNCQQEHAAGYAQGCQEWKQEAASRTRSGFGDGFALSEALELGDEREQVGMRIPAVGQSERQRKREVVSLGARDGLPHEILEHQQYDAFALIVAVSHVNDLHETVAEMRNSGSMLLLVRHGGLSSSAVLWDCLDNWSVPSIQ